MSLQGQDGVRPLVNGLFCHRGGSASPPIGSQGNEL